MDPIVSRFLNIFFLHSTDSKFLFSFRRYSHHNATHLENPSRKKPEPDLPSLSPILNQYKTAMILMDLHLIYMGIKGDSGPESPAFIKQQ